MHAPRFYFKNSGYLIISLGNREKKTDENVPVTNERVNKWKRMKIWTET